MFISKSIPVFIHLLFILAVNLSGQAPDSLLIKARMYYNYEEPEMALPLVIKYLKSNETDQEAIRLAGDCYMETGQYESAISLFSRALLVDPPYSDIYYKLGNLYDRVDKQDSAVFFFQKFNAMKPSDAIGYIRLAALYLDAGRHEEAFINAELATLIEPENTNAQYIMGMVHFARGDFDEAFHVSDKAIKEGVTTYLFYQLRGLSLFHTMKYENAYLDFSEAAAISPQNAVILDLKAKSLLMKNTNPLEVQIRVDDDVRFKQYNATVVPQIVKETQNPEGAYYFNTLSNKFFTDPYSFGLLDFFMFYIGGSSSIKNASLSLIHDQAGKYLEEGLYEKAIETSWDILKNDPASFLQYWHLAMAYLELEDYDNYFVSIYRYYGFLEAIKASGDGKSVESAFVITEAKHEYTLLQRIGYVPEEQVLVKEKADSYEVFTIADRTGQPVKVYFNVEIPLSTPNRRSDKKKLFSK